MFASNEENNKFAGGFVAVPYQRPTKVTHNDVWLASHEAGKYGLFPTPRAENHWLQGGVTSTNPALIVNGQSVAGITARDGGILRMSTATWRLASIGTDASDAVAFYTGIYKGRRQFYSGVTSGTDLGAPVQSKSGSATWVGQLSARQNVGTAAAPVIQTRYGDIALTVAYTQTGGSITGGLSANPLTSPGYTYQVRGRFNEDGLVEGNVNTVSSRGTEAGFLSGLIGQGVSLVPLLPRMLLADLSQDRASPILPRRRRLIRIGFMPHRLGVKRLSLSPITHQVDGMRFC